MKPNSLDEAFQNKLFIHQQRNLAVKCWGSRGQLTYLASVAQPQLSFLRSRSADSEPWHRHRTFLAQHTHIPSLSPPPDTIFHWTRKQEDHRYHPGRHLCHPGLGLHTTWSRESFLGTPSNSAALTPVVHQSAVELKGQHHQRIVFPTLWSNTSFSCWGRLMEEVDWDLASRQDRLLCLTWRAFPIWEGQCRDYISEGNGIFHGW